MTVGEVVRAAVTRAEGCGLYLACDGQDLVVLIPEVAWTTEVRDCRVFAGLGEEFDVKVLGFDEKRGLHYGSIKQAHPEDDPWRDPETFRPGTAWVGTVTHRYSASRPEWGPCRLHRPVVAGGERPAQRGGRREGSDRGGSGRGPGRRGRCPLQEDRLDPVAPSPGGGSGVGRRLRLARPRDDTALPAGPPNR